MTEQDDMLKQAAAMVTAMGALGTDIRGLKVKAARQEKEAGHYRHLVRALLVSIVFDIALSVGLAVALNSTAHQADVNTTATHTACVSTNEARAEALQVWTSVLNLSAAGQPDSPTITKIRAEVAKTYAPRPC